MAIVAIGILMLLAIFGISLQSTIMDAYNNVKSMDNRITAALLTLAAAMRRTQKKITTGARNAVTKRLDTLK